MAPNPQAAHGHRGGAAAWAKSHLGLVGGGVALLGAAGLALYEKHKSSSASSAGSSDQTETVTPSVYSGGAQGNGDQGAEYDDLEQAISALQSGLAATTTTANAANADAISQGKTNDAQNKAIKALQQAADKAKRKKKTTKTTTKAKKTTPVKKT